MKAIVPCSSLKMDCPCKLQYWESCGCHYDAHYYIHIDAKEWAV